MSVLRKIGRLFLALSALLLLALTVGYLGRWDAVAAATFLPFWTWSIAGLLLTLAGWFLLRANGTALLLGLLWLAATVGLSDDISRFVLSPFASPPPPHAPATSSRLRIVTLNCAGHATAAAEVVPEKPDIVFLQESPPERAVAELAQTLFGSEGRYLYGLDCSLIARGNIEPLPAPTGTRFLRAKIDLTDGPTIDATNLRLNPPEIRLDLWSAACWKAHHADRMQRRHHLQALLTQPGWDHPDPPRILAGDFNVSAGDGVLRLLKPTLRDAFREAGIGWGNSAINDLPVARPDQIWISRPLTPLVVWTQPSTVSDHRMVLCDLEVGR